MNIKFIDSHCHLDFDVLFQNLGNIVSLAHKSGIIIMNTISTKSSEWKKVIEISEEYNSIYCSIGIHPNNVELDNFDELDKISDLLDNHKIIGIGETGLDLNSMESNIELQKKFFRRHVDIAITHNMPIIIHERNAHEDIVRILKDIEFNNKYKGKLRGVMHCYTGKYENAKIFLDMGFYISFSGIVTFKNALEVQRCAQNIPLDRMLIETDSPFLAPIPYRGKDNQPSYITEVAKKISDLRGLSLESISEATTNNFYELFSRAANYSI